MILKETILSAFNERGTLLKWLKKVEKLITEKVLVKPVNNPQSTEIVAVNSTGVQVMLEVGTGLTIDNGVLKFADAYDGTVIIEKADSVLGLRRFKDTWQLPESGEAVFDFSTTFNDSEASVTLICDKIVSGLPNSLGANFSVVSTIPEIPEASFPSSIPFATISPDGAGSFQINYTYETFRTINVIKCDDVVEKWLLANTEGVSV